MSSRLSSFALKIVVHSVGGSVHLLGDCLNLWNQLPTVGLVIQDNSRFMTKKKYQFQNFKFGLNQSIRPVNLKRTLSI